MSGGGQDGRVVDGRFGSQREAPGGTELTRYARTSLTRAANDQTAPTTGRRAGRSFHILEDLTRRATRVVMRCLGCLADNEEVLGLDPVVRDLETGRPVVLATTAMEESHRVICELADRLNRAGLPARATVVEIDVDMGHCAAREVRMFGAPFSMSDGPARVAASLGATIYPVFAVKRSPIHHRVCFDAGIRPRATTEGDRQRTSQRIAWAFERFLRRQGMLAVGLGRNPP